MLGPHRVIVDDCLGVLGTLSEAPFDLVYLDPPYGTGRGDLAYQDGVVGGEWVDFLLRPRLAAVRAVLKPTGVLLMSVDEEHFAHASILLDEVFGRRCRLGTVILSGASNPSARFIATGHEYVLAYARSVDRLIRDRVAWRESRPGAAEILEAARVAVENHSGDDAAAERALKEWWSSRPKSHPSRQPGVVDYRWIRRGEVVRFGSLAKPRPHHDFEYDVAHPVSGRPCPRPTSGLGVGPRSGCSGRSTRGTSSSDRTRRPHRVR